MQPVRFGARLVFGIVVSLGLVAGPASAVTNLAEGFEQPTAGSADGTGDFDPPDNGNPFDPGTQFGFAGVNETVETNIQVRTAAAPGPGPAEGDQYLQLVNESTGTYIPFFSPGIPNTESFSVTFWVYNPGGTGLEIQIGRINDPPSSVIGLSNVRWNGGNIQRILHASEGSGWSSITPFTPGQWQHVGLAYDASGITDGTFDLYIDDFTTPVAADLRINNPGFSPPLNNILMVSRSGTVYVDGLEVIQAPVVGSFPTPVEVVQLQFNSDTGLMYRLESSLDLGAQPFADAGNAVMGDGGLLPITDPIAGAMEKSYRLVIPLNP